MFGVRAVIEVARPRNVTLEQTYGISAFARFRGYFNALVQMFTVLGFSVRREIAVVSVGTYYPFYHFRGNIE